MTHSYTNMCNFYLEFFELYKNIDFRCLQRNPEYCVYNIFVYIGTYRLK